MEVSKRAKMLLSVMLDSVRRSKFGEMPWTEDTLHHDVMGVGAVLYVGCSSSSAGGMGTRNTFVLPWSSAVR